MNTVYSVKELSEAYKILSQEPVKVLAGGTDLMVLYNSGTSLPKKVLDIWQLDELRSISEENDHLKIGALCTYSQLINDERVKRFAPSLVSASRTIGAVQIQNRGTIGGNIVNGSPAGDSLPVLAAFDARLEIGSVEGIRQVAFNEFYKGYRQTVLSNNELLLNILLPKQKENAKADFYKVGTRAAQAISKIVMAVQASVDENKRISSIAIAVGSVAPTVIRASKTENLLHGSEITFELIEEAKKFLSEEVKPINDIRSTEHYRRVVTGNLIAKFLRTFLN
jgi:CO/xanthine dehydrogenase FAD-binding subunit